jgi:hypothetical protein
VARFILQLKTDSKLQLRSSLSSLNHSPLQQYSCSVDHLVGAGEQRRRPIRGTLAGCCARAASGHAPPRSVMNSRRFIGSPHGRPVGPESRWARSAPPTERIAHLS